MSKVFLVLLYFAIGHTIVWWQLHGQFFLPSWKDNVWPVIITSPLPTIFFWKATKLAIETYDIYWAGRLIGFSVGIPIFALLTFFVFGEAVTSKTLVCFMLACAILFIQVFL